MAASITLTFEHKQFTAALGRLQLTPARQRVLMKSVATGLLHTTRDRFATSTAPDGARWAGLNPAYAANRNADRILVQRGDKGGLLASLSSTVTAPTQVTIGSNKVYAAVHQFGATIVPRNVKALVFRMGGRLVHARRVTIPARPYLGFGPADEAAVVEVLDVLLPGGR